MSQLFTNNAATTIATTALTAVATSVTVASGAGALFPSPTNGDFALITLAQAGATETSWEIVRLTARTADVLTIVRGQENTTAAAWNIGDKVELRATAGFLVSATPAKGGGNDSVFDENDAYVTQSYTIGQTGLAACTVSIASPAVVTQNNNYVGGEAVFFNTTGALPTGFVANTTYFVSVTGLSKTSYQLSATRGGASIVTTGSQSGVQTIGKAKSAATVGPLTIASGNTVKVPSGQRLVVM